ncbi:MAG: hypothetical protein A2887_06040 [Alphaproteobacteria bacterium RIFCSPLOWO2_01_FULL_40_26]|nr:MAG: hypothetical protein A3D15_04350 [Alphaproteobacteria bacterium RIFCSPHIGHO2_02_FULL_40_34]OFW88675.1 MAG: hypothetical protein A2794_00845 [Alphaproteobacteria bacterium RIFCSPHIGHO2_01_FULL_40_8]OFW94114.1 MAG: hypothetical protein A2887_06040 [Alphaproteobacteria bacterium RIFCSPLOWO2_01_FULL_40_26]OFX09699.1 MAG: hypothetical protein A3H30_06665 [Alphaproteobacteria bacterium RIFCSPLOWO2_02_FULL_40_19]OFX11379.1 MAG: hypothetical protein A3G22_06240 [Alphaproteobacteria bacterium RI
MNHHKLIIRLSLIFLLPIFSCSSKAKKIEEKTSAEAPIFSFEIDNKKLDLNYIKAGCDAVNSIQDQIPANFSYIDCNCQNLL